MTTTFDPVDVLLVDTEIAQLRSVTPADRAGLETLYAGLSPESIYLRFFSRAATSGPRDAARLTRPADGTHDAVLAELDGRIVGVAGYERLEEPTTAEVAFVVDDAHHRLGIATLLLEHLVARAATADLSTLVAETLPQNREMLEVFAHAGLTARTQPDDGSIHVEIDLDGDQSAYLDAVGRRESQTTAASLTRLLCPRSIAVVGAGADPAGLGHQIVDHLAAFPGAVAVVNRSGADVAGRPGFRSLADVPTAPDLVVVAVPAAAVLDVAHDAAARGAGGLVVISAGFAEGGADGIAAQRELLRVCRSASMRLVGPNCMGVANAVPGVSMNATFCEHLPPPGGIGLLSQSGAVGIAALAYARRTGIGLSSFVSAGNKADVSGNDLLCFWEHDPQTQVCALYLESFGNPRKFARIASRVGRSKPIVAVKSGRSIAGTRGVSSHTAAAATPDISVDSLFAQAGVIRVDSMAALFDVAGLLDVAPLPSGDRVAIIGNSGGPGVLAADACDAAGLTVPLLTEGTRARLAEVLPDGAAVGNPVDLLAAATPEGIADGLEILLDADGVDSVIVVYTPVRPGAAEAVATAIANVRRERPGKTIVAVFLGVDGAPRALLDESGRPTVPFFAFPEPAAEALAAAVRYARWRDAPRSSPERLDRIDRALARRIVDEAMAGRSDGCWLDGASAAALVAAYGVPIVPVTTVTSAGAAVDAARAIGAPVAIKVAGEVVHKTDRQGVRLGVHGDADVAATYADLEARFGEDFAGALIEPMVDRGVELAVGIVSDPAFGPLVMVALGGVTTDLVADRAFRLVPMSRADAAEQVESLRGAPLLHGYRGSAPCDTDAVTDVVLRVARLAEDFPEIAELDINPVAATSAGAVAVDVKVRVHPADRSFPLLRRLPSSRSR